MCNVQRDVSKEARPHHRRVSKFRYAHGIWNSHQSNAMQRHSSIIIVMTSPQYQPVNNTCIVAYQYPLVITTIFQSSVPFETFQYTSNRCFYQVQKRTLQFHNNLKNEIISAHVTGTTTANKVTLTSSRSGTLSYTILCQTQLNLRAFTCILLQCVTLILTLRQLTQTYQHNPTSVLSLT